MSQTQVIGFKVLELFYLTRCDLEHLQSGCRSIPPMLIEALGEHVILYISYS